MRSQIKNLLFSLKLKIWRDKKIAKTTYKKNFYFIKNKFKKKIVLRNKFAKKVLKLRKISPKILI